MKKAVYSCTKDGRNPKNVRADNIPEARWHYIALLEREENIKTDSNSIIVCELYVGKAIK